MKSTSIILGLALAGTVTSAQAATPPAPPAPTFSIDAGGDALSIALKQSSSGLWVLNTATLPKEINGSSFEATTGLTINPDPSINFGFGVTNDTSTVQTYSFTFPMPSNSLSVNLPPGTYSVASTFGITLTAGSGDTAKFSLPAGITSYMQSFINGKDAGVDVGSATETVSNGTEVFNFPGASTDDVLTSTGTSMSVTTTFDLTPGDSASFSGSFVVQAVPEPSSVALGLIALGACVVLVARSRRAQA